MVRPSPLLFPLCFSCAHIPYDFTLSWPVGSLGLRILSPPATGFPMPSSLSFLHLLCLFCSRTQLWYGQHPRMRYMWLEDCPLRLVYLELSCYSREGAAVWAAFIPRKTRKASSQPCVSRLGQRFLSGAGVMASYYAYFRVRDESMSYVPLS